MTTVAWIFMGVAFVIIAGAAVISLNKIMTNDR